MLQPAEGAAAPAGADRGGCRGTIAETLASGATHFEHDDAHLLKFHGIYQQDSRDERRDREAAGAEKAYSFMVRVAIPAGAITAEQYLALETIADRHANGTLRVTTRQGFQFHGVFKGDLKPTIAAINRDLLSTIAACGDVQRNVHVVPGVSSAIAGPAAAGIPVTARGIARSFTVITGHVAGETPDQSSRAAEGRVAIPSPLSSDTIVLLMARANLGELADQLISKGWDPSTPAACIQSATTPEQRVTRATLATIAGAADRDGLEAPVVTVIGAVAALAAGGAAGQRGSGAAGQVRVS